ncbi:MAG TPA: hypothetical protein VNU19_12500 [Candidatus Acidoferrum sp.]|jgi:hypothetical protein|nr:hypothetical protein [Candidatus Acidoferrum sp.]
MRHFRKLVMVALSALSLVALGSVTVLAHDDHTIVQFSSMTPVTGAAVGALNDRGLVGGGKAWVIGSGTGTVSSDGQVMVSVTGLVIPDLGNVNPLPKLKAIVSCVTQHHVIVNVSTGLFDATGGGNVTIDDTVALPRHCGHAIVFVTSPSGAWFAMSNPSEDEESDD